VSRPIAVDLFAGAGGMTLGFEQAGFDVLASVEIDPIHCGVHHYNFPHWTTLCADISQITAAEIREQSAIGKKPIDVVFGGPPCQGFSVIGKRALDDPRNTLVYHFIRLVQQLQPKFFVIENVKGMAMGEHRLFIQEIIEKFAYHGYQVDRNYKILNARDYGVPQNRERLFLLGCHQELCLPHYPQPLTHFTSTQIGNPEPYFDPHPTVKDAIEGLPKIYRYPELETQDWVIAPFRNHSHYGKILHGVLKLVDDYSYPRKYDKTLLTSSLKTRHTPESIQRFKATKPGKVEPISRFLRLDPKGLCNTLRAGTPGDRGAYTSPRPIHPFEPRCITVREAARLHSYPDWFRFHRTKWHGFRQVGNSVPPFLAKAVAAEIGKALGYAPVRPRKTIPLDREATPQEYRTDLLEWDSTTAARYYRVQ